MAREDIKPMDEMGPMDEQALFDYYATIGEALENGMSEEEAAALLFGPDVDISVLLPA